MSHAQVARRMTKQRDTYRTYTGILSTVQAYEKRLNTERWTQESDQYKAAMTKVALRDYMRALDRLQLLMVQRMFELAKTHVAGTGTLYCRRGIGADTIRRLQTA